MNTYLLDADVLINAHRTVYPMQVAPGFWEWLELQARTGTIRSIDTVKDELLTPELRRWTESLTPSFFQATSEHLSPATSKVSDWVNNQPQYTSAAKRTFERGADPDLNAYALQNRQTIVTSFKKHHQDPRRVQSSRCQVHNTVQTPISRRRSLRPRRHSSRIPDYSPSLTASQSA